MAACRSATRSSGASTPQDSRTRSAGTAASEPSTDWWVIACGTSISDSTPPSDSASVKSLVRCAMPIASGWRNETMPLKPGQRTSTTPGADFRNPTTASALAACAAIRRCSVRSPRWTRKQSNGPGTAPTLFWTNRTRSCTSGSRTTTAPPTVSECPPRYLVTRVHDRVGAQLQRALVDRRRERVVDRDERAPADRGDLRLQVDDVQQGVGRRLDPHQLGVLAAARPRSPPDRPGRPTCRSTRTASAPCRPAGTSRRTGRWASRRGRRRSTPRSAARASPPSRTRTTTPARPPARPSAASSAERVGFAERA